MIEENFFRSMSLSEDLDQPSRFAHYRPTRRATSVLEAVLAPNSATMVIAPYGSGKSLAAGVASLSLRNGEADATVIEGVVDEIEAIEPALGNRMRERLSSDERGLVVVINGFEVDPLGVIARSAGMARKPKTVEGFGKAFREGGWDHVAIVWDEFGRHLEGLIGEGRPDELDLLQRLAERCARAEGPTMSLTVLLHQNLLAYASKLNETTRTEWRKVEGRFTTVRMVEDSQEIYGLISQVVAGLRPETPKARISKSLVGKVRDARWLDEMEDVGTVQQVLEDSRPLTPGALQILPTLVARVGQHERSLFSFLREADLTGTVGIEEVYTAFADAMRSDIGIGGAYRRWLETESARSRAKGGLQREALAAACVLQLGTSGERRRLPRAVLELALSRPGIGDREIKDAIDRLIEANLLLWRRHNDDVTVWHGADIDVSLRVKEERSRQAVGFDLEAFLEERFPAPNLRTPGHNARFGVNRFFKGSYLEPDRLGEDGEARLSPGIVYVLARSQAEIDAALAYAKRDCQEGRILVVPSRPVDVESAAIEVLALEALRSDREFTAADPMISTELDELQSVAFEQFATLLRSLLDPRASQATWWAAGVQLPVTADRPASMAASALLDEWYHLTPAIANEQLMRETASRTMQTARVRVVGSILERGSSERLGYDADDKGAEASVYRTVLERTGLYGPRGKTWRFADPDEIEEEGLRSAWTEIAWTFRNPTGASGLQLANLLDRLSGKPNGVPRAVQPLLIAAGYKRFARCVALYQDGIYVPDILGFQFDQMVMHPEGITLRVERSEIRLINYLRELCYAFSHSHPGSDDELVRAAFDAIVAWRVGVPEGSVRTRKLDGPSKSLLRAIDSCEDPIELLLHRIPKTFGMDAFESGVVGEVERARKEIDALADVFAAEAMQTVEEAFRVDRAEADLLEVVRSWADCFDMTDMEKRGDLRISDKAVLRKAHETANGRFSPKSFAGALSSILLQRALDKWDDRTAVQFRAALRESRERIETAALDTAEPNAQLRPVVEARLKDLNQLLARIDRVPKEPDPSIERKQGGGQ